VIEEGNGLVALRSEWMDEISLVWLSDEDDRTLAQRAATDRECFGILYDRYVDRIYGFCYRRLQTRDAAEDATSQTFLKALAALTRRNTNGQFSSWLFTIAYHVVIDSYRAPKPMAPLDDARGYSESAPGPEELALTGETGRELYAIVNRLPAEQADLLHLRLSGLNDREIADVLGKSYGAIRVAQHRAMKRLRELASGEAATKGSRR